MDRGGEGDDSHRDDAENFSDFLSRVSLVLLFLRARQSVWGKSVRSSARPMATLGDDCLDPNSLSSSRVSAAIM